MSADDDRPVPSVRAIPVASVVPTLRMGPSMALPELASSMGISDQELVTALVTRGFFSVTVTSVVSRETGRAAAAMFGWTVEDDDNLVPRSSTLSRRARKESAVAAPEVEAGAKAETAGDRQGEVRRKAHRPPRRVVARA